MKKVNDFSGMYNEIKRLVNHLEKTYNFKKNTIWAQVLLETGRLKKVIGKNLFNIKATKYWKGKRICIKTTEYVNNKSIKIVACFRDYPDFLQSILDYVMLIEQKYKKAWQVRDNPAQYYKELQAGGYATDPMYARKLITIYNTLEG